MNPNPSGAATIPRDAAASAALQHLDDRELAQAQSIRSVYVYEAPIRVWHWTNALAIIVLAITGYLIASPLPTTSGEASDHYVMGTIRFVHFTAGYVLGIGLLVRIYWAFVGNAYAKELFWLPVFQMAYWRDVWFMCKWYAFVASRPGQYVGHNPLARLVMFCLFLVPVIFMALTGFALYSEGQGIGGGFDLVFGWVIPLLGGSQAVHTWHHLGMWALLSFMIVHIYAGVREEILGRSSMASTMISGHRTFKD